MTGEHYVYLHTRASDGAPFYVGKGCGRRAWANTGRNRQWRYVARKHGREVRIVCAGLQEPCALTLERIGIATIGRDRLANHVDGGGGTSGWRHSPETRERIGAYHRGRPKLPSSIAATAAAQRGCKRSDEHRAKLSAAKKGTPRAPHSPETRAKIAAAHVGLKHSDAVKAKMKASHPRLSGKASPSYDHTVRSFHHPIHGEFVGTRAELIAKHALRHGCASALISGRRKSVQGWRLQHD